MPKPKPIKVGSIVILNGDALTKMTVTRLYERNDYVEAFDVAYFNNVGSIEIVRLPKEAVKLA